MSMFNWGDEDEALANFKPDFSVDINDVCPYGKGGHKYREIENDGKIQVLKCDNCGYLSIGYY